MEKEKLIDEKYIREKAKEKREPYMSYSEEENRKAAAEIYSKAEDAASYIVSLCNTAEKYFDLKSNFRLTGPQIEAGIDGFFFRLRVCVDRPSCLDIKSADGELHFEFQEPGKGTITFVHCSKNLKESKHSFIEHLDNLKAAYSKCMDEAISRAEPYMPANPESGIKYEVETARLSEDGSETFVKEVLMDLGV